MSEEPEASPRWDGWLSPKQWIPMTAVLVVSVAVLGVLLLLGRDDDTGPSQAAGCAPGDPACSLRQPTHQHADFALFIRGTRFDFNQPQFISSEGDELSPNAHIHAPRFTVVHVHREGTTWDEFLTSLGFKLTDPSYLGTDSSRTCMVIPGGEKLCNTAAETWKFYVNGVKVDGVANTNIHDLDRVLLSYGSETETQVLAQDAQVTDQACIPSEKCRDRIPTDEPPEQCTISNDTCTKPGG
jgi:hypothetical protein